MSFFGFDTSLPRDRGHQSNAPGFAAPQDAFASLSGRGAANDDDAYVRPCQMVVQFTKGLYFTA